MSKQPFVSVFIPYYNDEDFLKDSIESVLNQTYENFELILLNHASTDKSRNIAHSYNDKRIRHIDMDVNLGAGSTVLMEKYLKIAKGEYAKLFCADDIMLPNCIKTLVSFMIENPDKDIIFADMEYIDKNKKSLKTFWSKERPFFDFEYNETETLKLLFKGIGFIPYVSSMVKMDILKAVKKDSSFIMLVDMNIWANAIINGAKIKFIQDIVAKYRIHTKQTASSANKNKIQQISLYESMKYIDVFNKIKDLKLLKELCEYVPFINDVTENDVKFFPFIFAYNNLNLKRPFPYRLRAYNILHDYITDEKMAKALRERFNFGIKEFRELYSAYNTTAEKPIKEIGICKLIFLILRKIWKRITLQSIFKKKKYTE